MADKNTPNDVSEIDLDWADFDKSAMVRRIDELGDKNAGLERENGAMKERIGTLMVDVRKLRDDKTEMEEALRDMQKKVDQSESENKAMDSIAARAAELEIQVSRLQHELISTMSDGDEANAELLNLKGLLEEKGTKIDQLEKAKEGLQSELEKTKAEVQLMAVQLRNESNEKARVEEEAKKEIGKKESEISALKKRIEEMESVVANNSSQLGKMIQEKKTEVRAKEDAIKALKIEKERAGELESKLATLMEELEESNSVIRKLKDKTTNGVIGIATTATREDIFKSDLKVHWPAIAVATGTVVATAAVVYLRCAKRT